MADTVRERVLAAFKTTLEGLTVFGLSVERNRDTQVTEFPALVMRDGEPQPDDTFATYVTRYVMPVEVEGYVRTDEDGKTVEQKIDQLYGLVVQALLADPTLGGLAVDVAEQPTAVQRDTAEGHPDCGAFLTTFLVEFWTRQGDPYTVGP